MSRRSRIRRQRPSLLLLIDIDDFKRFNDEFGHLVGDEVLRFVAKKIKETVKGRDFLARFGGEEFAVILPQTSLAGAASVAENIRSFFETMPLRTSATAKEIGVITVSIGVARFRPEESSEELIRRTDKALYAAKSAGRNHVVTVSDKQDTERITWSGKFPWRRIRDSTANLSCLLKPGHVVHRRYVSLIVTIRR